MSSYEGYALGMLRLLSNMGQQDACLSTLLATEVGGLCHYMGNVAVCGSQD